MNYQFRTENSPTLRACVFIDSSNPELPNQIMNNSSHPFIRPPFPPLIDPKDLLIISKDNKPSRSPNAFIIYRKVFLKTTREQGYFLPMTIVSSMASKSWDQETDEVRSYYKKLAKEAYKYRTEKFPKKVKRRRKKEPWNANIAFQNDLHNTFYDNSNRTEYSSSSSPELLSMENVFSNDISSQNSSKNSSPNLEQQNNEISLSFNENNLQEFFSSPDLSNNSSIMSSPEFNDFEQINIESSYDRQDLTNSLLLNQNNLYRFNDFPGSNFDNNNLNTFSNASNHQIDHSDYTVDSAYPILARCQYQPYQDSLEINSRSGYYL
jgi:hypothetical protein